MLAADAMKLTTGHDPETPPPGALRARREMVREQMIRGDVKDIAAVLPHLAASPGIARGFAGGVAKRLQGPLLTMDARRELIEAAGRLGIGAFEANLIIAAVQHVPQREAAPAAVEAEPAVPWLTRWWLPLTLSLLLEAVLVWSYLAWRG